MKTIIIKHGCMGRYDNVSPFLVEDGSLALHFVLPRVSGEFYLTVWHSVENGQRAETVKIPETGDVELKGLLAGELQAEVKHYLRGELIETFKVEPLLLKAVDSSVFAFPEIVVLNEKVEAEGQAREIWEEEMEKKTEKALACISVAQRAQEIAFIAFAWAEYKTSFTVNKKNLSLGAFVEVFGYAPLTEEEIEKIRKISEVL